MCGIFGLAFGPDGPSAEEWVPAEFAQLMFPAIVHRGPHAYGFMYYTGDDELVHVEKWAGRADTDEAFENALLIPTNAKWVVGHVRYFTHGDPSNNLNNHPISHGRIVGVHNGIIRNYREVLDQTGREDDATEVDSEAIFAAINAWGHRAGLRKIDGDMVAVYANREKPNLLNIARSYGRPLVFARTRTGALMFASEERVIEAAKVDHGPFSPLSRNRLLRVREGKVVARITYRDDFAVSGRTNAAQAAFAARQVDIDAERKARQERAEQWARDRTNGAVNPHPESYADRRARRGRRRGNSLPLGLPPAERHFVPSVARKPIDGTEVYPGWYWYNGVLVSEQEYEAAISAERGD